MQESRFSSAPLDPLGPGADGESAPMRQLVCFTIGDETYGIDIRAVREIRAWSATTVLPNAPDFVRGVINLRGTVVPILDLRARFGRGRTEPTKVHVVIVVAIDSRIVGILVDTVSDIVAVATTEIRPVPEIGGAEMQECLDGLIAQGEQMIALVAADRIVAPISVH
ncbi:MAG: chemotaxis protein CheW [Dongiaceae bacterium]